MGQHETIVLLASFAQTPEMLPVTLPAGRWHKRIDTEEERYSSGTSQLLPTVLDGASSHQLALAPWLWVLPRRQGAAGEETSEIFTISETSDQWERESTLTARSLRTAAAESLRRRR